MKPTAINAPVKLFYQQRDILDLSYLRETKNIVNFTVLPPNNVNSFFQNRAQYWRLGSSEKQNWDYAVEKCHCCEFIYPTCNQLNERYSKSNENSITISLLAFLKTNEHVHVQKTPLKFVNHPQKYQAVNLNQQFINSGTTLTLLNMMSKASQINASAFQISNVNNTRYSNMNNNFGLYKQF